MKHKLIILSFVLLFVAFSGCYTQLKMVDRSGDYNGPYYTQEEEYYDGDSTAAIDSADTIVENYYIYNPEEEFYDPSWDDPWYYWHQPRIGVFLNYSMGWWDPYWSPWGWYYGGLYPFVTVYNPWAYYGFYWDPYYSWWDGTGYYGRTTHYGKRPFQRRSETANRRIVRGSERTAGEAVTGNNRRIVKRQAGSAIQRNGTPGDRRRIIRTADGKRVLRNGKVIKNSRRIRSGKAATRRSHTNRAVRKGTASSHRSKYRPAYRRSSARHSGSRSYRPRSSSSSRSRPSSGSSIRSSSGSRGSSSSGSSRSSSSSGSSRSVRRR